METSVLTPIFPNVWYFMLLTLLAGFLCALFLVICHRGNAKGNGSAGGGASLL